MSLANSTLKRRGMRFGRYRQWKARSKPCDGPRCV